MGRKTQLKMSWIDRTKRAPDVPLKLWRVDCAGFWGESLKKESRHRLQTARDSWARQRKEKPEYAGAPKSARRPSYVDDPRRAFTSIDPRYMCSLGPRLFGLPEGLESQGSPIKTGSRQSEDRSYGQSQTYRFTHERSDQDPNHRFRRPPTSSMEVGWNAWGEVKRLHKQTRSPRKQSAMSNYADKMLLPAGAPCSIGNVGGNDTAWRTNVI